MGKDLQSVLSQLPIDGQSAFTNRKKKFREKLKKQQLRILKDFVPILNHQLEPGETILLAMRGVSPFRILEELTTGWWIFMAKRCLLVLTDRRILHFPATLRFRPRNSVFQIRFTDIESFKARGRITFRYRNGQKEVFHQVRNGRKFKALFGTMNLGSGVTTSQKGRHPVCPRCTAALTRDSYACRTCRLKFKNPRSARLYSIFLPGGGYFYTRHFVLGLVDAVVEAALIFLLVLYTAGYFLAKPGYENGLVLAAVFGVLLFLEKLITVYHAEHFIREYLPAEKTFRRIYRDSST